MAKEKAEKAKPRAKGLSTAQAAAKLKIEPKRLRTILRSLPQFKNNGSARYELDDLMPKLPAIIKDFEEKAAAKKASSDKKKPAKKAATKKKSAKKSKKDDAGEEAEELV